MVDRHLFPKQCFFAKNFKKMWYFANFVQKWVHLIVLYAKHIVYPLVLRMNTAVFIRKTDGYTVYMDTNQSQKAVSC